MLPSQNKEKRGLDCKYLAAFIKTVGLEEAFCPHYQTIPAFLLPYRIETVNIWTHLSVSRTSVDLRDVKTHAERTV